MLTFIRSVLVILTVFLMLKNQDIAAIAQEYQGCFMVNTQGQVVDLSEICGSTPSNLSTTTNVQVTLQWQTADDLDLRVTDPIGQTVSFFNPSTASGGQLNAAANPKCLTASTPPVEKISWSAAPGGNYSIAVSMLTACRNRAVVPFTVTLLADDRRQTWQGTVNPQNPVARFPFSLPATPQ